MSTVPRNVRLQARTVKAAIYLCRFLVFVANETIELKDILTFSLFLHEIAGELYRDAKFIRIYACTCNVK